MARHIQYSSDAQVAYETAVEYSAGGSFGYFGFITEYCNDEGWEQELKVRAFFDPFAVYGILIPSCFGQEPQYAFVIEEIPVAEYKRLYNTDEIDSMGWDQAAQLSQGWIGTETVRVAEYWYIEHEAKKITRKNPQTGEEETRTIDNCKVKFCKINGLEVIEGTETDWPGYCIPIVPVLGKQIILEGKPNLFSVIRFQKDAQTLINAYKSRIAETLHTQPIQPYIVVKGQITKANEKQWAEMNTTLRPYLEVEGVDINGKPAPMPERQVLEPPIASLSEAAAQEIDDMKATAGIFDASLGAKSNEQSGQAILRRQQQSNVTNMHFLDNLERAFKKGGLIIADVMPKVYDSPRMIRILGEDEAPKILKINALHKDENGKDRHYRVGGDNAAKDEPIVTMGRAFSTKRMESFDMITQLIQGNPQAFPLVADILFRNSDLAGSEQLAERFHKALPPQLQNDDKNDPAAQAQALQGQLAQLQTQLKAIDAYAQQLEKEKEGKVVEHQAKVQIAQVAEATKLQIVKLQEATKLSVAQMNASKDTNQAFAEQEVKEYQILHDSAHDVAMQAQEHAHQQDMATQQHQQALEQGDQSHAQATDLAATQAALQPQPSEQANA
jgi:hypothetical protein